MKDHELRDSFQRRNDELFAQGQAERWKQTLKELEHDGKVYPDVFLKAIHGILTTHQEFQDMTPPQAIDGIIRKYYS